MSEGCEAALPLVEKLADGEASPAEAREAEAHLALCPGCREHLDALKSFSRLASESPLPEPPESYWEHLPRRVLDRIHSERLARRSFWQGLLAPEMLRIQAIVVSCVLLVAVGVTLFRSELRDTEAPMATAPPSPQAPAQAAPTELSAEGEKLTAEERADLRSLGYLNEAPPIARDEPSPQEAPDASSAPKRVILSPRPEAPPSAAPVAAPEPTKAREMAADVAGARVVEDRAPSEDESFRLLKQKEEEPEARQRSNVAASRQLSVESSQEAEPCAGWRSFLETYGDEGTRGIDARYELARCSLGRYEQTPADSSRAIAIADAEAFLERETEGPRAEEIRKALARVRDR